MPEFTPPPPVLDNWRDHTAWDGPVCSECGHPLWAQTSTDAGLCSAHVNGGDTPNICYDTVCGLDAPPYLVDHWA